MANKLTTYRDWPVPDGAENVAVTADLWALAQAIDQDVAELASGGGVFSDGSDGKDVYQVWLDQGNTGTFDDFLATLQGPKGDPGTGVPAGGTTGQLLGKTDTGAAWVDPAAAVVSANDLTDVDTTTVAPTTGQALMWDAAAGAWVPGSVATNLDALTDVNTTTVPPLDGQALVYRGGTWIPDDVATSGGTGVTTLDELTDVSTTGGAAGQALVLGADGMWTPGDVTSGDGTSTTPTPAAGAFLYRASTTSAFSGTGYRTVTYDTTGRADGGFSVSPTAGTITVPEAGWYAVSAQVKIASPANTPMLLAIRDNANGTHLVRGSQFSATTYDVGTTGVAWLTAGQTLNVGFFSSASAALTGGEPALTNFRVVALAGGASGGAQNLNGLSDVDTLAAPPVEGQVLTYTNGQWVPQDAQAPQAPSTDVQGVLVIPAGGVVPSDTPEGTLIFERTA